MRQNYKETNRMSKTTETEMVAEMKTGKTGKDNNAGQ